VTPCGCGGGCGGGCAGGGGCCCDDAGGHWPVSNPSGLAAIAYRVGDFTTFRDAMLRHLPGERELIMWRPTASDDLGLQLVDWWAYIADILTFYNERIANEAYLGTAVLARSVTRLVGLLGYRPRPGIGAVATLSVLASGPAPLLLPAGLAIASKASPSLDPQTFETTAAVTFAQPTSVSGPEPEDLNDPPPTGGPPASAPPGTAEAPPHPQLIARGGVLVKGVPTSIAVGDRLLLMLTSWQQADDPAVVVTVTGLVPEKDAHRRTNTRVMLTGTGSLGSAKAAEYRLARPTRSAHLASLPTGATVVTGASLVLDSPARSLHAGDPLLVELPGAGVGQSPGSGFDVVRLTDYAETLWYANAASAATPTSPPSGSTPGVPLIVAALSVSAHSGANLPSNYAGASSPEVVVRSGWVDVGALLDTPVRTLTALPDSLTLARPPAASAGVATTAIVEDANGNGSLVHATPTAGSSQLTIAAADPSTPMPSLQPPLTMRWDLITVTRGASVRNEVLGVGDARQAGQDFGLAKLPVTYLSDSPGRSGDGYSSTVVLTVDGRYWTEVPTLYGRRPDELVFATYEDVAGKTHVITGDGINGIRLATGAQVSATYRVGSGAAVPPAGTLTQVLAPVPNLRALHNPVVPVGGGDPDQPGELRTLAPRSVLTFGRAVSGADYAAVAAAAPGVARAAAVWAWDPDEQRPMVRVYVGDDAGALASATTALLAEADPNRPLVVTAAVRCDTALRLTLSVDPSYVAADVLGAARSALLDSPDGLFAPGVLELGEPLYRSRIEAVLCAVPGVLATHRLRIRWRRLGQHHTSTGHRFTPGDGGFFALTADRLHLTEEVEPHD
jgi:hypothetical protein